MRRLAVGVLLVALMVLWPPALAICIALGCWAWALGVYVRAVQGKAGRGADPR